jgi:hypothetical protein
VSTDPDTEVVDAEPVEEEHVEHEVLPVPVPVQGGLVRPAGTVAEVVDLLDQYRSLCERILTDDDYQEIKRRGEVTRFKTKSAWRKLGNAFNVSLEVIEQHERRDDNNRIYEASFLVRATAPNGRAVEGFGACSIYEDRFGRDRPVDPDDPSQGNVKVYEPTLRSDHDIPATAHTRATNRACSDLFGLGEVSAEEMAGTTFDEPRGEMETRRSSRSVSDGSPRMATDKQRKMVRAKLSSWRDQFAGEGGYDSGMVQDTDDLYPEGWTAAGLDKPQGEWTMDDVDAAVAIFTRNPNAQQHTVDVEAVEASIAAHVEEQEAERRAKGLCLGCGQKFTKANPRSESHPDVHQGEEPFE